MGLPVGRKFQLLLGWSAVVLIFPETSLAQELITDQVSIAIERGQIFGLTAGEGVARQLLSSGEEVVVQHAQGVTGFVQTTTRLLGFSGRMQRWVEFPLSTAEQIVEWIVTPRIILVVGLKQGYGFQSDLGRWKHEPWGAGERIREIRAKSHVGLVTTNRRALAFSAFTGGFFGQDLPRSLEREDIELNDHIVILHGMARKLVFRSGLALWAELP